VVILMVQQVKRSATLPKTRRGHDQRVSYTVDTRPETNNCRLFETEAVKYRAVRPDVVQDKNFADEASAAEAEAQKTVRKELLF
jgi:hypothetical protein